LHPFFILGLLDRYDVRNLLDDQRLYTGPRDILDDDFLKEPSDIYEERFEDLDSDEDLLFDMDEDERKDYLGKAGLTVDPCVIAM